MPVTKRGIIYYPDDPHKRVFRVVYPTLDDSELDSDIPHTWTSFGVDQERPEPVMEIISSDDIILRKQGTPFTPKDEPVVYYVNSGSILSNMSEDEFNIYREWLGSDHTWSNLMVDLGKGDVSLLTLQCIAPCWIVIFGGGNPSSPPGVRLQKSKTLAGQSISLWVA